MEDIHINSNINQRKAGVAILLSDKADFRAKKMTRVRETHYIMKKGSIHKENIAILSVHAPNNRAAKYVNKKLIRLKEE